MHTESFVKRQIKLYHLVNIISTIAVACALTLGLLIFLRHAPTAAQGLIDGIPDWSAEGETDSRFGGAVADVGDVNGDGYSDVIIGAYSYNSHHGRADVYLGGARGLSATPTLTLTGEASSNFGDAVEGVGDVNGDGYSDVIIGAYCYGIVQGRAYVYLGGAAGLTTTPALTLTGENTWNYFGDAVGGAGDVNGDGYSDVLIGAYGYNSDQGRAYVYLGGAGGLSTTPALTLTGENTGDEFGFAVEGAGDVNGDGYSDVIIGARGYGSYYERAYLYLGRAGGLTTTPALILAGENIGDHFGFAVGGVGDVNGDGYSDVIVGAYRYNSAQGRAYVYLGNAGGLSATPALTLTGENTVDTFGTEVGSAGDVNGDGYSDALIGAPGYNDFQGRAYVYLGSAGGLFATPALTLTGENAEDWFGWSVGGVGDVNGDGYSDVLIGAPNYNSYQGRAYAYYGAAAPVPAATPALILTGESGRSHFGAAVGGVGDVNGDGYNDVLIGAPDYSDDQGRAYLYLGGAGGLAATSTLILSSEIQNDSFGAAVAGAGDVNGDGYSDALVSAARNIDDQGWAYVYLGSAEGLVATPALTLTGEGGDYFLGWSVGGAGDVNGDGYNDVIIGAYGYNSDQGQAYVHLGGVGGLTATPTITLTGENTEDRFGIAVKGVGDVNGDSYSDVLIAARGYNSNQGRVYVYLGNAGGLAATPVLTLTGENTGDYFGGSVGSAGDVNGDGYSDALIGAWGYNSNQGQAYVYLGGAGGLATIPALTLTGENTEDYFGTAVRGTGDVNGDGYSDVLISAYRYNFSQGRAYVYLGGAEGLSATPALILTGETTSNYFGGAVGGAGDVNGDGYSDILIGASYYNSWQGRAYAYYGNTSAGRVALPRQGRATDGTPVQPWGLSHAKNSFQVSMRATSPRGREQVKLQVQTCLPGVPFTHTSCLMHTTAAWRDVTTATQGVTLTTLISDLNAGTLYRWRARVLYAAYSIVTPSIVPPPQPAHGPWRRLYAQSSEADVCTNPLELYVDKDVDTGGLSEVPLGGVVTYTIVIRNIGGGVVSNVVMTDPLPSAVTFGDWVGWDGSALLPPPGTASLPTVTVTWAPGDLAAGATYTLSFTADVVTDTQFTGQMVENTAYVVAGNANQDDGSVSFAIERDDSYIYLPVVLRN